MHTRFAQFCFCLTAALFVSCGCDRVPFDRGTATASKDDWPCYGSMGGRGAGISLIAIRPDRPGNKTPYEPYMATAGAPLFPTDVHACGIFLGGTVNLWGRPNEGLELLSTFVPHEAYDLCFTADGKCLAYSCREGVLIWHIDERRFETRLPASDGATFALSADGRWVARCDRVEDGSDEVRVTVLDLEKTEPRGGFVFRSDRRLDCHISSDGVRLSTVAYRREPAETKAVVFNLDTGAEELAVPVDRNLRGSAWSRSGRVFATASWNDAVVQIWDMAKGELRSTAGMQSKIWCVIISPDERLVLTGGEGTKGNDAAGEVVVWEAATGRELARIWDESSWGVTALAMTDEGMLLIGNGNGYISVRRIPERILAQAR